MLIPNTTNGTKSELFLPAHPGNQQSCLHSKITMAAYVEPLLHSYCTGTYTEVTVLLLWSSCNATLEYPRRYSNRVAVRVLHGNNRVTSQEQNCYFSVGTSAVTV